DHDEDYERRGVAERGQSECREDCPLATAEPGRVFVALSENDPSEQPAPVSARAIHQIRQPQPLAQKVIAVELDQRVPVESHVQQAAAEEYEGYVGRQ